MTSQGYRYRFRDDVPLHDAAATLRLAVIAADGLFGRSRVQMDFHHDVDLAINAIIVDAGTLIGQVITAIFTEFLANEFGPTAFSVRQVEMLEGANQGGRR